MRKQVEHVERREEGASQNVVDHERRILSHCVVWCGGHGGGPLNKVDRLGGPGSCKGQAKLDPGVVRTPAKAT